MLLGEHLLDARGDQLRHRRWRLRDLRPGVRQLLRRPLRVRSRRALRCGSALRERRLPVRRHLLSQRVLPGQHLRQPVSHHLRHRRRCVPKLRWHRGQLFGRRLQVRRVSRLLGGPALLGRLLRLRRDVLPQRLLRQRKLPAGYLDRGVRRRGRSLPGLPGRSDLQRRDVQRVHRGQLPEWVLLRQHLHHTFHHRVRDGGGGLRGMRVGRGQLRRGDLQVRHRPGVRHRSSLRERGLRVQRSLVPERLLRGHHLYDAERERVR